jgi:hypothetical protein
VAIRFRHRHRHRQKNPRDLKEGLWRLAKQPHPDQGGDLRLMERLQKMRDFLLAFCE